MIEGIFRNNQQAKEKFLRECVSLQRDLEGLQEGRKVVDIAVDTDCFVFTSKLTAKEIAESCALPVKVERSFRPGPNGFEFRVRPKTNQEIMEEKFKPAQGQELPFLRKCLVEFCERQAGTKLLTESKDEVKSFFRDLQIYSSKGAMSFESAKEWIAEAKAKVVALGDAEGARLIGFIEAYANEKAPKSKKLDLDDPVYSKGMKLKGYAEQPTVHTVQSAHDGASILLARLPDWSADDHKEASKHHRKMAVQTQKQWADMHDGASVLNTGGPKFEKELRALSATQTKHARLVDAHALAAKIAPKGEKKVEEQSRFDKLSKKIEGGNEKKKDDKLGESAKAVLSVRSDLRLQEQAERANFAADLSEAVGAVLAAYGLEEADLGDTVTKAVSQFDESRGLRVIRGVLTYDPHVWTGTPELAKRF